MDHDATYSPEDNKLRLYPACRLDAETYARVKAAGFKWAPKQELFVAPMWTPQREDLLIELCGEIGDEDYSPEERSADRAERFGGYLDKRRNEAGGLADSFESGPSAFGHQNRARAERQAARHDRQRVNAVSQWSKAEYWQSRTAGVISHAMYKSSAHVRRGRILELEKLIRRYSGHRGYERWCAHLEFRLTYERAMLAEEGGCASDAEMEVGGWLNGRQIHKVNKSNTTGRVVSVHVMAKTHGRDCWGNEDASAPAERLRRINVERLGENVYRAPTDEEREAFKVATKERKATEKANKPASPSLVNPTEADAERLQATLNAIGRAKHEANNKREPYKPTEVLRMTQAKYSELSKGTYSHFETRTLHNAGGIIARRSSNMWSREGTDYDTALGDAVCKVRIASGTHLGWYNPPHIVVITDKPQKPLPLDWEAIENMSEAAA